MTKLDTLKRKSRKEFNELIDLHDRRNVSFVGRNSDYRTFLDTQISLAYEAGKKQAIQDALKVMPKKRTKANDLAGNPNEWKISVLNWNSAIDTITQALKKLEGGV